MDNVFLIVIISGVILLVILMCWQESRKRKISFVGAFLICLFTSPFLGYFIISGRPLRNPRGCKWCGNTKNEAEYCGLCGKNEAGEVRQGSNQQT